MKKFEIPLNYRSDLISFINQYRKKNDNLKKDLTPLKLKLDKYNFIFPRNFGICYGVENAIEIVYKAIKENPEKEIYLLSELIHNEEVNNNLKKMGVKFLMDTKSNILIPFNKLKSGNIVIIPAFGTTLEIKNELNKYNVEFKKYDSTCPFVKKVWNRSEDLAINGYTIIIHGKPYHEETKATFSYSKSYNTPCLVIKDMSEAILLSKYIKNEKLISEFYNDFKGQYSENFNPETDLLKIGVINQTTMLASETNEISNFIKEIISIKLINTNSINDFFADTKDTLCYATNDNQNALKYALNNEQIDYAIVIGGKKSSNTTNLYRLCEKKIPSFFIESSENIINQQIINHYDYIKQKQFEINFTNIGNGETKNILIVAGASCPDKIIEDVIKKLVPEYNKLINNVLENISI